MSGSDAVAEAQLRRGNLPFALSSFVGRRREVTELRRLLHQSRLVTLTGLGGVGKTRLALRVAAHLEREYRDGVWLVELAPLRDPALVAQAVVAALGMRDSPSTGSVSALAEFLRDWRALIVLDNCEHLAHACAVLANTVLRGAPELTILATSRQRLGVVGEHIFAVPPLPTPDVSAPIPPAEALSQYDAVTLLIERGQAAEPSFTVTPGNAEAVTRLAQRLDGIPLAIELAAARLRLLSPQQVLDRLSGQYDLLSSNAGTGSPRQESMQALIDWSFDLCTPAERVLWARLSVFPHDFDIDAAEQICAEDDELPAEQVMHALMGLVDKSIVTTSALDGGRRYRLAQTLREYGRARLVAAAAHELRMRHRDYYRRIALRSHEEWFGPRQVEWTHWQESEYVNLRAALDFCLAEGEHARGLAMAHHLLAYWVTSGSFVEGRRLLVRLLAAHPEPSAGRATALWIMSRVARELGESAAAEAAAEESLRLVDHVVDNRVHGMILGYLGAIRLDDGDLPAAERLLDAAMDAAGGDPLVSARTLITAASVADLRGDPASARSKLDRCLEICDAHGESWVKSEALSVYALVECGRGEIAAAKDHASEALRCVRAVGNRPLIEHCLETLAWIAAAGSQFEDSARMLGAADAVRRALGTALPPSMASTHDEYADRVRRVLGPREFRKATQQCARLGVDEAVACALGERPDADSAAGDVALTQRESQVADLVMQGLTNRDVAATLVISQRTAETHIEHILSKLGFTSRSQIAAWVAQRRAGPTDRG